MAMLLNDTIPAPTRRQFDPNKPNPNRVKLTSHGPRPAKLKKISRSFYEKNVGTDEKPRYVEAQPNEPGAIPRVRVTVAFTGLKNAEGNALELSMKMTASTSPKANLTKLIAGLCGIAPEQVRNSNVDLETLYERPVFATTKAGSEDFAVLTSIVAAPRDDEQQPDVVQHAAAPDAYDESLDDEEIPF
jgi:hypothetical protein